MLSFFLFLFSFNIFSFFFQPSISSFYFCLLSFFPIKFTLDLFILSFFRWTVLRRYGYEDDLTLSANFTHPPYVIFFNTIIFFSSFPKSPSLSHTHTLFLSICLSVCLSVSAYLSLFLLYFFILSLYCSCYLRLVVGRDCSVELSPAGEDFLRGLFRRFDKVIAISFYFQIYTVHQESFFSDLLCRTFLLGWYFFSLLGDASPFSLLFSPFSFLSPFLSLFFLPPPPTAPSLSSHSLFAFHWIFFRLAMGNSLVNKCRSFGQLRHPEILGRCVEKMSCLDADSCFYNMYKSAFRLYLSICVYVSMYGRMDNMLILFLYPLLSLSFSIDLCCHSFLTILCTLRTIYCRLQTKRLPPWH